MTPFWFNESYYLAAKANQLNLSGGGYTVESVRQAISENFASPYEHFTFAGEAEGVNPNPLFNRTEYLSAKAVQLNSTKVDGRSNWAAEDVSKAFAGAGLTAIEHYTAIGWGENINASNDFDTSNYLADKLSAIRRTIGADESGKLFAAYQINDITNAFKASGLDPLSHYAAFGSSEGLRPSLVPDNERVPSDPAKARAPVLGEDGKTLTVYLQSPLKAPSIEAEDFTVLVNGVAATVAKVAAGTGKPNYEIIVELDDASRLPGSLDGDTTDIRVVYNPNGGSKSRLETDAGFVPAFNQKVNNQSDCFEIIERVSETTDNTDPAAPVTIRTLNITLTPPAGYEPSADPKTWVKVDLTSTKGVVDGGEYGIITAPRLMDGALVHNLDTTKVSPLVSLEIKGHATEGGTITTGAGADSITLGTGVDVVAFTSKTVSQLSHMDTVTKFTFDGNVDAALNVGDKLHFTDSALNKVVYKGPLSLEGALMEKAIQGVFDTVTMRSDTAYLLQNGEDYLLVADSDGNGTFEAANDFALALVGLTGLPAPLTPGALLDTMIG